LGANLSKANLNAASVAQGQLHGANLAGTSLHGAHLSAADLHGADLSGAILVGADLCGAQNLTREQIESAITDATTILPDYLTEGGEEPAPEAEEEEAGGEETEG
jgi:uncharacterized protein YjbI with pentapeptide repeats